MTLHYRLYLAAERAPNPLDARLASVPTAVRLWPAQRVSHPVIKAMVRQHYGFVPRVVLGFTVAPGGADGVIEPLTRLVVEVLRKLSGDALLDFSQGSVVLWRAERRLILNADFADGYWTQERVARIDGVSALRPLPSLA